MAAAASHPSAILKSLSAEVVLVLFLSLMLDLLIKNRYPNDQGEYRTGGFGFSSILWMGSPDCFANAAASTLKDRFFLKIWLTAWFLKQV
jgi:hypothetical protein